MSGGFLGMPGRQAVTNQTDIAIGASGKPIRVYDAYAVSDGTATTVKLINGTAAGGADFVQIDGVISKSANLPGCGQGLLFPAGCFADVDSHTVALVVSFVQEI